ncbi:AIPR family protein [Tistrella mobilis]
MSINAQLIDQRVEGLMSRVGERLQAEVGIKNDPDKLKSAAFVFLVAQTLMELDDDEVLDGLVDGGGDFGIDAIYFGSPDDGEFQVTLLQGKYKRSLEGDGSFPETGLDKMFGALRTIFDPNASYTANRRLKRQVEEIRSLIREGNIPAVRIVLCNNGRKWNSVCDQRIKNAGFGDLVRWEYAGPDELVGLVRKKRDVQTRVQLSGRALVEDYAFMRAMVGRMSVLELARLFDEHGDVLLDRNIRRYLGLAVRVNDNIAATLKDPDQRGKFYFYNNGITIVCTKFAYNALSERDWIVQITGLQIVNGGQTSKTIQHIRREVGAEIGSAQVLVRIYELPVDDEELVQRITAATNSQSPVDLRDLRSHDQIQKNLSESIQPLGFTYRRQRFDNAPGPSDITSTTAAEAVLAVWRHRPHSARFASKDHFGTFYDLIFTSDLNGPQVVIAVLLLRIAENKRKRPPEGAPDFLQYGSRFIAMLMGGYLLEDLGQPLPGLTHRNFPEAHKLVEEKGDAYFQRALETIKTKLDEEFSATEPTLQKLSATFRRADLVEKLRGGRSISIDLPVGGPPR